MSIRERKSEVRRATLARVAALGPDDRREQEAKLVAGLDGLPGFAGARTVLIHASAFADEVGTGPMLRRALAASKRLACPQVDPVARRLVLRAVADLDRDLVAGFRGIREPDAACPVVPAGQVDWALVPGIAFDRRGYRVGRGGGYYDRLLPTLREDAGRWSLILDAQWVDEVPREDHDRPVDGVVDHRSAGSIGAPADFTRP